MGQIAAANAVQDRQHRALRHAAKRKRLRPGGDEEVAATRRRQPPAHFNSAKAIAVGLYRGPATSLPALGRQPAPVRNQRLAIKQPAGGDIGYHSPPISGAWQPPPPGDSSCPAYRRNNWQRPPSQKKRSTLPTAPPPTRPLSCHTLVSNTGGLD